MAWQSPRSVPLLISPVSPKRPISSRPLLPILLFLLLFGSFAYFHHQAPGWNVNSRLALTLALAEQHTPSVDLYIGRPETHTGDVAFYDGHYYSDKIIGTSLLGVPARWFVRILEAATDSTFSTAAKRYWITGLAICLPAALSGVLLFYLLILYTNETQIEPELRSVDAKFQAQPQPNIPFYAALISALVMLGSLLFHYATLFMSYLPAQFFLLAAIYIFEHNRLKHNPRPTSRTDIAVCLEPSHPAPQPFPPAILFLSGMFAGLAVLCEYTLAIATGIFGLYAAYHLRRPLALLPYGLGVGFGVLPFLIYTMAIFGRPVIPYQFHANPEFRESMSHGLMGATIPRLDVLWLISIHPFRGLFAHTPLLALGVVGLVLSAAGFLGARRAPSAHCDAPPASPQNRRTTRPWAIYALAATACYLLFNSAYYMWWGGWGFGPRHLAPAIPLLATGIMAFIHYRSARAAIWILGLWGVIISTIVNATDPQLPDAAYFKIAQAANLTIHDYPIPFLTQVWPAFSQGRLDQNLGQMCLGLQGIPSLTPLLIWWFTLGWLIYRIANRRDHSAEKKRASPLSIRNS